MGTALRPSPFDPLARALPDEPRFVLLARDPLAGFLVQIWSDLRACVHGAHPRATFETASRLAWQIYRGEPDLGQANEAATVAMSMHAWRQANAGRWCDPTPSPTIGLPLSRAEYEAIDRKLDLILEGQSTMATQVDQVTAGLAALATDIDNELASHEAALEAAQQAAQKGVTVDLSGPLATISSLRAKLGEVIAPPPAPTGDQSGAAPATEPADPDTTDAAAQPQS